MWLFLRRDYCVPGGNEFLGQRDYGAAALPGVGRSPGAARAFSLESLPENLYHMALDKACLKPEWK